MSTVTFVLEFGPTVTLGELNVAVFANAKYPKLNGYTPAPGPVPTRLTCHRSKGSGGGLPFVIVSCCEPPFPSPSENFDGVTHAGVCTAGTICARPLPCRQVGSRPAALGLFRSFGMDVFISSVCTCAGVMFLFFACRISAARPATCGDAIDVPLMLLWPPNCWCGQVE